MSLILYFFLFVFLVIVFFILSVGMSILKVFVRKPRNNKSYNSRDGHEGASNQTSSGHQKVFGKDEGEYVDYEEIE